MRWLLASLFAASSAFGLSLTWDQPEPGAGQIAPDGWRLYINGVQEWQGHQQVVDVDALNLPTGDYSAAVRAYAAEITSDPSNTVAFSIDPPTAGAPLEVAPTLTFRQFRRPAGARNYG